jgi:hypothetical protein
VPCLDHVVLNVAAYSMLGPKQCSEVYVWMRVKKIGSVLEIVIDRSLVTDQAYALASNQIDFFGEQTLNPKLNWLLIHSV